MNLEEVAQQADDYETLKHDSLLVNLVMLNELLATTHPYPVVRVREIRGYAASADYADIVAGKYRRLGAQHPSHVSARKPATLRWRRCHNEHCACPCDEDYVYCPSCNSNLRDAPLRCTACGETIEAAWNHYSKENGKQPAPLRDPHSGLPQSAEARMLD